MFKLYKMQLSGFWAPLLVSNFSSPSSSDQNSFVELRLVPRRLWKPRPDWPPALHCHAVNPHHMVRPLGLLTDELGKQVYRLLFHNCRGQISFERRETRSTCGHLLACLGTTFFYLLMRPVSIFSSLTFGAVLWTFFFMCLWVNTKSRPNV